MGNDITPVQRNMQEKLTHVTAIKERMAFLGWSPAELSRRSGVSETDISRLLERGVNIWGSKIYDILKALGLINITPGIPQEEHSPAISKSSDEPTLRDLYEIRVTMDKLMVEIGKIKDRMLDAADNKDVTLLRKVSGNG